MEPKQSRPDDIETIRPFSTAHTLNVSLMSMLSKHVEGKPSCPCHFNKKENNKRVFVLRVFLFSQHPSGLLFLLPFAGTLAVLCVPVSIQVLLYPLCSQVNALNTSCSFFD